MSLRLVFDGSRAEAGSSLQQQKRKSLFPALTQAATLFSRSVVCLQDGEHEASYIGHSAHRDAARQKYEGGGRDAARQKYDAGGKYVAKQKYEEGCKDVAKHKYEEGGRDVARRKYEEGGRDVARQKYEEGG